MNVKQLIEVLKTYDQSLPVAYEIYSEQCLLTDEDLRVKNLGEARLDGWAHNYREDAPSFSYLVFRGN